MLGLLDDDVFDPTVTLSRMQRTKHVSGDRCSFSLIQNRLLVIVNIIDCLLCAIILLILLGICKCHSIAHHPWRCLCVISWDDVIVSEGFTGILSIRSLYHSYLLLYSDLANLTSLDLLPWSSKTVPKLGNSRLLATSATILSNKTSRSMSMATYSCQSYGP